MPKIIGEAYKELRKVVKQYADEDKPVLLVGETGSGKELFAQLYMNENIVRKGTRMAVNCSALPETLLPSEIFGHTKGAFTGATERQKES